jgi:hypothetical protein
LSKPVVDGFQRSHKDTVTVIRLDVRSELGNRLAYQFGARAVPTFLMFDNRGQISGRHVGIATSTALSTLAENASKE